MGNTIKSKDCKCPEMCGLHWSRANANKLMAQRKGKKEAPKKTYKKKEVEPTPEFYTIEDTV